MFFPPSRTSGNNFFTILLKICLQFGSCDAIYTNMYIPYLSIDPLDNEGALYPRWGDHPVLYSKFSGSAVPGVKWPGRETGHLCLVPK